MNLLVQGVALRIHCAFYYAIQALVGTVEIASHLLAFLVASGTGLRDRGHSGSMDTRSRRLAMDQRISQELVSINHFEQVDYYHIKKNYVCTSFLEQLLLIIYYYLSDY